MSASQIDSARGVPGAGHYLSRTHLRIARAGVRSITGGGRLIRFGLCTGRPAMARQH
jgi:hypothetical protein